MKFYVLLINKKNRSERMYKFTCTVSLDLPATTWHAAFYQGLPQLVGSKVKSQQSSQYSIILFTYPK